MFLVVSQHLYSICNTNQVIYIGKIKNQFIPQTPSERFQVLFLSSVMAQVVPVLATRLQIVALTLVVSWATRQRDYLLEGVYIFQNIFICEL